MNHLKKYKNLYLSIFSGLMTALSFVVPSFGVLAWFSVVPFLCVLFKENHSGKSAFLSGFSFAFSFYLPLCSWVFTLASLEFISKWFLILLLSVGLFLITLIMATGYGIIALLFSKFKIKNTAKPFVFSFLWILLEYTHRIGSFGFTWGNIALTQYKFLPLIQSASIFGALFVSYIILMFNSFVALAFICRKQRKSLVLFTIAGVLVFNLNVVVGKLSPQYKMGEEISVSMIWSNDNPFGMIDTEHNRSIFKKMIAESDKKNSDIILWSETALALIVEEGGMYDIDFCNFSKEKNCILGVGGYRKEGENLYTSIILYENGKRCGYIDKRHLVPFGEYIPFGKIVRKVAPFVNDIFPAEQELTPQKNVNINNTSKGKTGGIICYDSCFPNLMRTSVKNGAEILLMSTNDSWFYGSHAIENHLSQSVFRAVENGRYIVRCANKGVSGVISPKGKIEVRNMSADLSVDGKIYKNTEITFYTRYGDVFVLIAFVIMLVICLVNRKRTNSL